MPIVVFIKTVVDLRCLASGFTVHIAQVNGILNIVGYRSILQKMLQSSQSLVHLL